MQNTHEPKRLLAENSAEKLKGKLKDSSVKCCFGIHYVCKKAGDKDLKSYKSVKNSIAPQRMLD